MNTQKLIITAAVFAVCSAQAAHAVVLQPDALMAWNAYTKNSDLQMQQRAEGRLPFLWIDESPDRAARLRHGEVVIAPVAGNGAQIVAHGLVHDWIGGVFIPGATIASVWSVVHNYNDYQRIYRPVVTHSKTLACSNTSQEFEMVWQRKVLFVSVAMQGHYRATDVILDEHRGYSVAEALQVREFERYGHSDERLLPADTGDGFIWRIRSVARYAERDGGVYLELEAMALTREIPASLAWLVNPVVNHLSVNSLTATLRQTRDAVFASRGGVETLASCPLPARGADALKAGGE